MRITWTIRTPLPAELAARELARAWRETAGDPLTVAGTRLLLSLVWVETELGIKAWNYSPGNFATSKNWVGLAWRPSWYLVSNKSSARDIKLHADMLAGRQPGAFRAYDGWVSGFDDFASTMRARFPEVIKAANAGNVTDFRIALASKYSKDYLNNVNGVESQFVKHSQAFSVYV